MDKELVVPGVDNDTYLAATLATYYNLFMDELFIETAMWMDKVQLIFYPIRHGKVDMYYSIIDVVISKDAYVRFFDVPLEDQEDKNETV